MTSLTQPIMMAPQDAAADWRVLPAFIPVDGMGVLAVNSFLLQGAEPVLVDTGLAALGDSMIEALADEIDLDDLRWIWLSHTDADHIGNFACIIKQAPQARVVTNFLGAGKMMMLGHDRTRLHILDPGQTLQLPDRVLHPVRPPYYDAPETHGFVDSATRVLFAADAFGALLPEPVESIDAVDAGALRDGLVAWSTVDAPWLQVADRNQLGATLAAVDSLRPSAILSGHLPHAGPDTGRLTREVHAAWVAGGMSGIDPLTIGAVSAALDRRFGATPPGWRNDMNNFHTAGQSARRRRSLALGLASIGRWWTQRRDTAILSRLSDSTLRDIGLQRDFFRRLHPRQDAELTPAPPIRTSPRGAVVDYSQPERTNPMTTNLNTVRRFLAGTHSNTFADIDVIDETVAEGVACHGFPGFPNGELVGREP